MKLTPEKFKKIEKRWIEKKDISQDNVSDFKYASKEQSKFQNTKEGKYFKFVPCPICLEDRYKIFHKRTKYTKVKWKDLTATLLVKLLGTETSSSILSYLLNDEINLSLLGYSVVKCSNCGFLYRNPTYKKSTLKIAYDNTNYLTFLSGEYSKKRIDIYKYVLNLINFDIITSNFDRRRILDIGCGFGLFLNYIKSNNWEPFGLDFSSDCIEYCKKEFNISNVTAGSIEENIFDQDYFDVVTLWSVAAHLDNPLDTFQKIHKVLRKQGYLIVFTVNAESLSHQYHLNNWDGFTTNHLVFFDSKTLTYALKKTGFISVDFSYDSRLFDRLLDSGSIQKTHTEYFESLMRNKYLGDMMCVVAKNG